MPSGVHRAGADPWGTPLVAGIEWAKDASNTVGGAGAAGRVQPRRHPLLPALAKGKRGSERGVLVLNHEYTDASQIYTAAQGSAITADAAGVEKVAKALAGHGVTVVEVRQNADGSWTHVEGSRVQPAHHRDHARWRSPVRSRWATRRWPATTPPMGTLNNCGNGHTPWGTYLACEENWNGYFGTADSGWTAEPGAGTLRGERRRLRATRWHVADPRFDVALNPNELHRFGWVVEIDPMDPHSQAGQEDGAGPRQARERGGHRVARPGGGLHRRRREPRVRLQVRRRQALARAACPRQEPARRGDPVRREVRRGRHRHAGSLSSTARERSTVGQRLRRPGGRAAAHPPGGRRRRRDPAAPARVGRRSTSTRRTSTSRSPTARRTRRRRQDPARPTRWSTASATRTRTVTSCSGARPTATTPR